MDKKTLIFVSIFTDTLDIFLIGQTPGIATIVDLPALILHVVCNGPAAFFSILDMIPGIGFIPIFTILAFSYQEKEK